MSDLLFESLASACGLDWKQLTRTERGRLNKAVKELREIGATPEQVRERAAIYRQRCPDYFLTPQALVGNWSLMAQCVAEKSNLACLAGLIGGVKRIPK